MSASQTTGGPPLIRIGELSRRTGVRADTLRAWERRYSLLEPVRTEGGFRLYGPRDEDRARRMSALIAEGHSAAQAAAAVLGAGEEARAPTSQGPPGEATAELVEALTGMDEARANAILDRVLATLSLEAASEFVLLPALREIGARWAQGAVTIAQEHFASNLLRARLLALSRGWRGGGSSGAVLACPPGEQHDLGLILFALLLHDRGWRITYLGADTPVADVNEAADRVEPAAVVISALDPQAISAEAAGLRELARRRRLLLGGAEEVVGLAGSIGAEALPADPVEAAAALAPGREPPG